MTLRIPPAPAGDGSDIDPADGAALFAGVMRQAPTAFAAYLPFIEAVFARLQLSPYDRELIILYTVHLDNGAFEWVQHADIAVRVMGMPQALIDAIAADDIMNPMFGEKDRAMLAFVRQVVKDVRVDDSVYAAVALHLPPREIVEALFTIGNYMLLSRMSEVTRIPIAEAGVGAAVLKSVLDSAGG